MAEKKAATINDVARLANVHKRTVTRVINKAPNVSKETHERVQKAIDELKFSPSKQARGLASNRSYLIGLLYDEPNAVVIFNVQQGIISLCSEVGYELVVHPASHRSDGLVSNVLDFVTRSKIDGLLIMSPMSSNEALVDAIAKAGVPYVRMAPRLLDVEAKSVVSCDREAMEDVVSLFKRFGAENVGLLQGPENRLVSEERTIGFKNFAAKYGLTLSDQNIVRGDFNYNNALEYCKTFFENEIRPDAVFASNDQMAVALMQVAEDYNISVPEDLLVIGYDDEPMSNRIRPTLSTLSRANKEMAEAATKKLLRQIDANLFKTDDIPTFFKPILIERESSNRSREVIDE